MPLLPDEEDRLLEDVPLLLEERLPDDRTPDEDLPERLEDPTVPLLDEERLFERVIDLMNERAFLIRSKASLFLITLSTVFRS
ncbi:MAG: hypothetical protein GVY02_07385 [Bacteroidetes bacterium]|nr:hypothetical protein [Bacteroidota bacterium]